MSSPSDGSADLGLLSPVTAGTAVEDRTGDEAVLAAMSRAEAALLRALAGTGIAPPEARTAAEVVEATELDPRRLALDATTGGNPVIGLVGALRTALDEQGAAWLHHGATSQDIVDTSMALITREVTKKIESDLADLADTLSTLTERHRRTPAVARTLTQQALPTTLGMRFATWLTCVHDAIHTIRRDGTLPASLGGPVGTGSAYGTAGPEVVDAFATELDLPTPTAPWHTTRAPIVRLSSALTITGESCGKIAADVLVLSQTEVGEVREAGTGGSSSMPHKANPAQSVLVNSAARQLPALGSVLGGSAAAEQERPAGAWHAEWQPLRRMLRLAAATAERTAALVDGLTLNDEAIGRNVELLLTGLGRDHAWLGEVTASTGVWIDRIQRRHREEFT